MWMKCDIPVHRSFIFLPLSIFLSRRTGRTTQSKKVKKKKNQQINYIWNDKFQSILQFGPSVFRFCFLFFYSCSLCTLHFCNVDTMTAANTVNYEQQTKKEEKKKNTESIVSLWSVFVLSYFDCSIVDEHSNRLNREKMWCLDLRALGLFFFYYYFVGLLQYDCVYFAVACMRWTIEREIYSFMWFSTTFFFIIFFFVVVTTKLHFNATIELIP